MNWEYYHDLNQHVLILGLTGKFQAKCLQIVNMQLDFKFVR